MLYYLKINKKCINKKGKWKDLKIIKMMDIGWDKLNKKRNRLSC